MQSTASSPSRVSATARSGSFPIPPRFSAQVPPLAHHSKEELVSALQQGINTSDEMKRQDLTLNARLPVLSVILASTLKK
jgi:hypothetical protein